MIAVVRMRYCPRTRAYVQRRTTQGKSKREILRCLKRYIARQIYHTLHADLTAPHHLTIYRNVRGNPTRRSEAGARARVRGHILVQRAQLGRTLHKR
jgi:hypothetical protein